MWLHWLAHMLDLTCWSCCLQVKAAEQRATASEKLLQDTLAALDATGATPAGLEKVMQALRKEAAASKAEARKVQYTQPSSHRSVLTMEGTSALLQMWDTLVSGVLVTGRVAELLGQLWCCTGRCGAELQCQPRCCTGG